jgi:hypothetical protein
MSERSARSINSRSRRSSRPSSRFSQAAAASLSPSAYDLLTEKRQEKEEAILACEYEKSRQIQMEIDALLQNSRCNTIDEHKEQARQRIQADMANFDANLIAIRKDAETREREIRSRINECFEVMQSRQRAELKSIELRRIKAQKLAENRETRDFRQARIISQRLAREDRAWDAGVILREATELLQNQRRSELTEIVAKFDAQIAVASQRHGRELRQLESDLDTALGDLARQTEAEVQGQRRAGKVAITAALHASIANCTKDCPRLLRGIIITQLTQSVKDFVVELDKAFLL